MKIQNNETGKIITVWPSTDHPDSSYGLPVWVDKQGNSYGQCDLWAVPFGFKKISSFEFTAEQYQEFKSFLQELINTNWGCWEPSKWLTYPGLPGYALHQYIQENDKTFITIKFDDAVILPDRRQGRKFKVGGDRNYQPVCERF